MFSSCMPKSEINKITETESLLGFLYPYSLTEHNTRRYNLKGLDQAVTLDQALLKLKSQLDLVTSNPDIDSIEVNTSTLWKELQVLAYLTYLKNKIGVWDSNHESKQQLRQNETLSQHKAEKILRLFSGETTLDEEKIDLARKQLQAHSSDDGELDNSSSPLLGDTQASSSPIRVKNVRKDSSMLDIFGIGSGRKSKHVGFQAEIGTNETQHIDLSVQYLLNTYGRGKKHEGFKSLKDIYRQLLKNTSDKLERVIVITDAWNLQGDRTNEKMAVSIVLSEIKKALAILCNNNRQLPDTINASDNTKLAKALAQQQRITLCPLTTLLDHQLVRPGVITAQPLTGLKKIWPAISRQIDSLFSTQVTSTKLSPTQEALLEFLRGIDEQNPSFNKTGLLTKINDYLKSSPLPLDELQLLTIMQKLAYFDLHEEKNHNVYFLSIQPGIRGIDAVQTRINTLVLEAKLIRFAIAESRAQRTKPLGDSSAIAQLFNYCLTVPYSHYAWSAIEYCMNRDDIKSLGTRAISRILNDENYRVFEDRAIRTDQELQKLAHHEQSLIQIMANYQANTRKLSRNKYSAQRDKHAQQALEPINSLRSFFNIKRGDRNQDTYIALEDNVSLFSLEHADKAVEQYTQAIERETNDPNTTLATSSVARLLATNGIEEIIYVSSITYIDPLTLSLSNLLLTRPLSDAQYEIASVSYLMLLANALNNKGSSDAVKAAKQRLLGQIFQQLDRLYAQLTNTSDVATVPLEQLYCYRMLVDFIHSDTSFKFLENFHALKRDNITPVKKYRALLQKHNSKQPSIFYKALVTDALDTDPWNKFQNIEFGFLRLMLTQLDHHIQQAQQTYLEQAQPVLEHAYKLVFKYLFEAHQNLLDKLLDAIEELNGQGFDINDHRTAGLGVTEEDIHELKNAVIESGELAAKKDQKLNARLIQQVDINDALSSEVGNPLVFMPTKTKDKIIENSWLIRYIIARVNQGISIHTLYGENPTFFAFFATGRHSNYKDYLQQNQLANIAHLQKLIDAYKTANRQLADFFHNYESLVAQLSTTITSIQGQERHYQNKLPLSIDAAYAESGLPEVPKPNYNDNPDAFNRYLKLLFEHQLDSVIDFLVTENLKNAHSQLATYLAQIYGAEAIEFRVVNSTDTVEIFRHETATLLPSNLTAESKHNIANAWEDLSAVEANPADWYSQLFKIHQAYTAADITHQQTIALKIARTCHEAFKSEESNTDRPMHATLALDMLHLLIQSNSDDLDLMIELADVIQHPEAYYYIDADQNIIERLKQYIFNYAPEQTSNPHLSMASSRGSAMRTSSQRTSSLRESLSTTIGKERAKINKLNHLNELWISLSRAYEIQSKLREALNNCFQLEETHDAEGEATQAQRTQFINQLTALLAFKISEAQTVANIDSDMVGQAIAQATLPQGIEIIQANIEEHLLPQMKTNWLELRKIKLLRDIDDIKIRHESPNEQAQKLADTLTEIHNLQIGAGAIDTAKPAHIRIYFALWIKLCKLLEYHPELIAIGNTKEHFNIITQGFFQDLPRDLVHPVDQIALIHYISWQYHHGQQAGPNSEYLDKQSPALQACLDLLNMCCQPLEFETQWAGLFQIIGDQEMGNTLKAETLSVKAVQNLLAANEQLVKIVLSLAERSEPSELDRKNLGEHIDWVITAVLSHVVDFLAASKDEIYQNNIKNLINIFSRYLDFAPEGRGSALHQLSKELFSEIDYLICSQAKIAVSIIPDYFVRFKEAGSFGKYSQRVVPNIEQRLELFGALLRQAELQEQATELLTAMIESTFPAAQATTAEALENEELNTLARKQLSSYFIDNNVEFSAAITLLANQCEDTESFQLLTKLCLVVYGEAKTLDGEIQSKHLHTNSSAWRNLYAFTLDQEPDLVDIDTTCYFVVANLTMLNNLITKEEEVAELKLKQLAQTAIDSLATIENTQLPADEKYCEQFEVLALSDGLQEQYKFCNILATGEKYKLTRSAKREKHELVMTFDNNLLCYQLMLAGRLNTGKSKEMFTACALNWQCFSYVEENKDDQLFNFYPNWEIHLLFNQEAQELLVKEIAKVIRKLTNDYVTEKKFFNRPNFLTPRHAMLLLNIANASISSVYGRALVKAKDNGVEEQFFYQQLLAGIEFIYDTTEEGLRRAGQENNPVPTNYRESIEAWAYPVALDTMTNKLLEGELYKELMSRHLSIQQIDNLDDKGEVCEQFPCYKETFDPSKQTLYRITDSVVPRRAKQHSTSGESDSSPLSRRNSSSLGAGNKSQKESQKTAPEFANVIQFIYFCRRIDAAGLLPKKTAEAVKNNATSTKALERINTLFVRIQHRLPPISQAENQARMSTNSSTAWYSRDNSGAGANISTDFTHKNGYEKSWI